MRLVTLNVRNPSFDDGPNAWSYRRTAFYETLKALAPDVLCLQETILSHAQEIARELGFSEVHGVPRETGERAEMCAILVRETVRGGGTEWLCETPDVPGSRGWGAACPRVVTWVDFGAWVLFNVHLDHVSLDARTNGMAQVVRRADDLGKPAIVVGDLNATPDEPALQTALAAGFLDLETSQTPTFHGFGQGPTTRIDYILARGPWTCDRAWVVASAVSDHHPVAADLVLSA